ncbi:hypothetical protein CEXT_44031, partial [Caerostris extrusa]
SGHQHSLVSILNQGTPRNFYTHSRISLAGERIVINQLDPSEGQWKEGGISGNTLPQ